MGIAGFVDVAKGAMAEFADDLVVLNVKEAKRSTFRASLLSMRCCWESYVS